MSHWSDTLSRLLKEEGHASGVSFLRGLVREAGQSCDQELLLTMIHFQSAAIYFESDSEEKKRMLKELYGDVENLDQVQGDDDTFTRYSAHSVLISSALDVGPHPEFLQMVEPSLVLADGARSDPLEGPEFVEIANCFLYGAFLVNWALGRREDAQRLFARIDEPYQSRDEYLLKMLVPFGVVLPGKNLDA